MSSAPVAVSQKLTELSVGKATSRTPSCRGHGDVHEADHKGHRHEQDHDRAVGGEDLIVMVRRQVSRRVVGQRQLRSHHDRIGQAAQHHDRGEKHIHHANALVIAAGDPFAPKIRRVAVEDDKQDHGADKAEGPEAGEKGDRMRPRDRVPGEFAKHAKTPLYLTVRDLEAAPALQSCRTGPPRRTSR